MNFLLDTHILVWLGYHPDRLSRAAREILDDQDNLLRFSAISIYEVAIKSALGKKDFQIDALAFRDNLLANDFEELAFSSNHGLAVQRLPALHKDPFDRALIGQAVAEKLTLLTGDAMIASYPGPIRKV